MNFKCYLLEHHFSFLNPHSNPDPGFLTSKVSGKKTNPPNTTKHEKKGKPWNIFSRKLHQGTFHGNPAGNLRKLTRTSSIGNLVVTKTLYTKWINLRVWRYNNKMLSEKLSQYPSDIIHDLKQLSSELRLLELATQTAVHGSFEVWCRRWTMLGLSRRVRDTTVERGDFLMLSQTEIPQIPIGQGGGVVC